MKRAFAIIENRQEIALSTSFDYPPIPVRNLDWSAIDADTYDADYLGEDETGSVWSCSPSGHGATEFEAVNDLIDRILEA